MRIIAYGVIAIQCLLIRVLGYGWAICFDWYGYRSFLNWESVLMRESFVTNTDEYGE